MAKYNIYKIEKDKESSLLEKLQAVGLSLAGQKGVNGFTLSFYFSQEPRKAKQSFLIRKIANLNTI
jgi:hypothetical protein